MQQRYWMKRADDVGVCVYHLTLVGQYAVQFCGTCQDQSDDFFSIDSEVAVLSFCSLYIHVLFVHSDQLQRLAQLLIRYNSRKIRYRKEKSP